MHIIHSDPLVDALAKTPQHNTTPVKPNAPPTALQLPSTNIAAKKTKHHYTSNLKRNRCRKPYMSFADIFVYPIARACSLPSAMIAWGNHHDHCSAHLKTRVPSTCVSSVPLPLLRNKTYILTVHSNKLLHSAQLKGKRWSSPQVNPPPLLHPDRRQQMSILGT